MKELRLGLDGVLPIMDIDLENRPICMLRNGGLVDFYMLNIFNSKYAFKRILINDNTIVFDGILDYGDDKNFIEQSNTVGST